MQRSMPGVAKRIIRCAIGAAMGTVVPLVLASCGSQGEFIAPFGKDGGLGFVGSGPGGGRYHLDGSSIVDAGPQTDGEPVDAGHLDGAVDSTSPPLDANPPVDSGNPPSDGAGVSDMGSDGFEQNEAGHGGGPDGSQDSSTDAESTDAISDSEAGAAHDAGGDGSSSVGVTFNIPPGLFPTLTWTISGPATYSGVVHMGDAHSIEFVAGGIEQGDGYTLTIAGTDKYGAMCSGTSAPFNVQAGLVVNVGVVIDCPDPDGGGSGTAEVTTGSVGATVGVTMGDE
jgi:hypothetical protein